MPVLTLVLAAIAGVMAFWAGTVSLIGLMGWRPLAQRYPAGTWPEGEGRHLSLQSGSVGVSRYNNVLHAALTAEGLYLKPMRLFAYNHAPIFLPWEAVTATKPGMLGGLRLELEGGGSLVLRGRVAKEVEAALDVWNSAGPLPEVEERLTLDASESPSNEAAVARSGRRQRA